MSLPHLILVGNPGVGMATILNSLLGHAYFQPTRVEIPLRTARIGGAFYSDTPSLFSSAVRDAAALQIAAFLRGGAPCQLVFVCTVDDNASPLSEGEQYCIPLSDIELMVAVLRAATAAGVDVAHRTSVIVNQIQDEDWFARPDNRDVLEDSLGPNSPIFAAHPISHFAYMPYLPAAVGKQSFILHDASIHRNFIVSAPVIQTCRPQAVSATSPGSPEVFISHAGLDKNDIALPLHDRLTAIGIATFIDKKDLHPGDRGEQVMHAAMRSARVGVFLLSAEFAGRMWTMRELAAFLDRRERADRIGQSGPAIIPVFYRLNVRQCRSDALYRHGEETGRIIFDQGFFSEERQREMPTKKAARYMKLLTTFTGIENEEAAMNNYALTTEAERAEHWARRERLLSRIIDTVVRLVENLRAGEVGGASGLGAGTSTNGGGYVTMG